MLAGDDSTADPVPLSRQKTGPKCGMSALTDDMRQKLADFFADDLDIRYIGLVVGKRNQGHVIEELLKHVNDYIVPVTITRATLKRWLSACMNDCLVWEEEIATEEKDGGSKKSGEDATPETPHKQAWVQLMRDVRERMDREEAQKKKKAKFNAPSALISTSPRPYIASAAAPTSAEIQDVDAVIISKEGCAETMAQAIEAVQARKAAGLAAGNLNYKSPPPRQDMIAEMMASIRARDKHDDGMMSDVRRSMAFERLEPAEKRLERAELKNDQEEIERAKKSLKRIRDEIDAE